MVVLLPITGGKNFMSRNLLDWLNNNLSIRKKILLFFIPFIFLMFLIFGELSNMVYKYYIKQLAYNDLKQRIVKLKSDLVNKINLFENISAHFIANKTITQAISKYNKLQDIDYSVYLDDFKKINEMLAIYYQAGCKPIIYIFNKNLLIDEENMRYIETYPDSDIMHIILKKQGRSHWYKHFAVNSPGKLIIARALIDDFGEAVAIVNMEINLELFSILFENLNLGKNGYYEFLLGEKNEIFAVGQVNELKSQKLFVFNEKIDTNGFKIKVGFSEDIISDMGMTQRQILYLCMLFFILISICIAYLFSSLIVKRIMLFIDKINIINNCDRIFSLEGTDEISLIDKKFNEMLIELREKIEQEKSLIYAKSSLEAELLQSQFNPHFLYNTLSAVRWSTIENGDIKTGRILESLIMFYRASLSGGKPIITFGREIDIINNYVRIHKYTYEHEYYFIVNVEKDIEKLFCIKFLIQPFIENALKHGIAECERFGVITVKISRQNGSILILVEDNGKGIDQEKVVKLNNMNKLISDSSLIGYGVYNTIRRIKLYYGSDYGVYYESIEGLGTKVFITIPECTNEYENIVSC